MISLEQIRTLFTTKQYDQAIQACNELLAAEPGNLEAQSYLTQAKALKETMAPVTGPSPSPSAPAPSPIEFTPTPAPSGKKKWLLVIILLIVIVGGFAFAYVRFFRSDVSTKTLASFLPGEDADGIVHMKKTDFISTLFQQAEGSDVIPKELLTHMEEFVFAGKATDAGNAFAVGIRIAPEGKEALTAFLEKKRSELEERATITEEGNIFIATTKENVAQKLTTLGSSLEKNPLTQTLQKHPYDGALIFNVQGKLGAIEEKLPLAGAPPGFEAFLAQLQDIRTVGLWFLGGEPANVTVEISLGTEEAAQTLEGSLRVFVGIAMLAVPAEEKDSFTLDIGRQANTVTISLTVKNLVEKVKNIIEKQKMPVEVEPTEIPIAEPGSELVPVKPRRN